MIRKLWYIAALLLMMSHAEAQAAATIEMVPVPGGCYRMGDTFGSGDADEQPHRVCIAGFSIGKYPVMQGQWQEVMGSNPSHFAGCGANCPVENASWNDIQEFIRRLNTQSGKKYRLPYEAEWEYAARSGGRQEQWSGADEPVKPGSYAWFKDNSGGATHPVGQKQPNGLGLYDMNGNVWQWCKDLYDEKFYARSPEQNPRGAVSGSIRVLRGGSWASPAGHLRTSYRNWGDPGTGSERAGFRLAAPAP